MTMDKRFLTDPARAYGKRAEEWVLPNEIGGRFYPRDAEEIGAGQVYATLAVAAALDRVADAIAAAGRRRAPTRRRIPRRLR
jgi:hypothetical protein